MAECMSPTCEWRRAVTDSLASEISPLTAPGLDANLPAFDRTRQLVPTTSPDTCRLAARRPVIDPRSVRRPGRRKPAARAL